VHAHVKVMLILELRPIHDAALWMAPMPVIYDLPSPLFQGVWQSLWHQVP
jgi:hypothetical protein